MKNFATTFNNEGTVNKVTGPMRPGNGRSGSALILTVVLSSLLAIVGAMFMMSSRVEKISTSGISINKDLNNAVDTIIAKISNELILDVPGVLEEINASSQTIEDKGDEYYDYPGPKDRWLASLEPYDDAGTYKWGQITDLTGYLDENNFHFSRFEDDGDEDTRKGVEVEPLKGLNNNKYVPEYPKIRVDTTGRFLDKNGDPALDGVSADADGDGIADSKWIELSDMTSSKG